MSDRYSFAYLETDIPAEMTMAEYRHDFRRHPRRGFLLCCHRLTARIRAHWSNAR